MCIKQPPTLYTYSLLHINILRIKYFVRHGYPHGDYLKYLCDIRRFTCVEIFRIKCVFVQRLKRCMTLILKSVCLITSQCVYKWDY